jgi:hypothetical protein
MLHGNQKGQSTDDIEPKPDYSKTRWLSHPKHKYPTGKTQRENRGMLRNKLEIYVRCVRWGKQTAKKLAFSPSLL